jgi:hypothetical protein
MTNFFDEDLSSLVASASLDSAVLKRTAHLDIPVD